jgi:DNA-binding HxlR family transcriptional regulator
VARKSKSSPGSGCPVNAALEVIGDRWSLLIVRDMMVRGYRTFREFQSAGEGIATNILADRLHKLQAGGIVVREAAAKDGRSAPYRLTEKGIALGPVLLELLVWGARHEETAAPCGLVEQMAQNRAAVLAEVFRRWQQRDPTPFLPPFVKMPKSSHPIKSKSNFPKGKTRQ